MFVWLSICLVCMYFVIAIADLWLSWRIECSHDLCSLRLPSLFNRYTTNNVHCGSYSISWRPSHTIRLWLLKVKKIDCNERWDVPDWSHPARSTKMHLWYVSETQVHHPHDHGLANLSRIKMDCESHTGSVLSAVYPNLRPCYSLDGEVKDAPIPGKPSEVKAPRWDIQA